MPKAMGSADEQLAPHPGKPPNLTGRLQEVVFTAASLSSLCSSFPTASSAHHPFKETSITFIASSGISISIANGRMRPWRCTCGTDSCISRSTRGRHCGHGRAPARTPCIGSPSCNCSGRHPSSRNGSMSGSSPSPKPSGTLFPPSGIPCAPILAGPNGSNG